MLAVANALQRQKPRASRRLDFFAFANAPMAATLLMLDQVYKYVHVSELSRVIINFTGQAMKWLCLASYISR